MFRKIDDTYKLFLLLISGSAQNGEFRETKKTVAASEFYNFFSDAINFRSKQFLFLRFFIERRNHVRMHVLFKSECLKCDALKYTRLEIGYYQAK